MLNRYINTAALRSDAAAAFSRAKDLAATAKTRLDACPRVRVTLERRPSDTRPTELKLLD